MKPAHILTRAGVQFIGTLVDDRVIGGERFVKLDPAYGFIAAMKDGEPVLSAGPPWTLITAHSVDAAVTAVTYLSEDSQEYADLVRDAETTSNKLRAKRAGLSLVTATFPGRPMA